MILTPEEIYNELDRHVIGQFEAKRAMAIALRNRWRRLQLDIEDQRTISSKNILLIGPSGVGKTEIARQLATMTGSPFFKAEATQYTEVGYVGKDITSLIEDIAAVGAKMLKKNPSLLTANKPARKIITVEGALGEEETTALLRSMMTSWLHLTNLRDGLIHLDKEGNPTEEFTKSVEKGIKNNKTTMGFNRHEPLRSMDDLRNAESKLKIEVASLQNLFRNNGASRAKRNARIVMSGMLPLSVFSIRQLIAANFTDEKFVNSLPMNKSDDEDNDFMAMLSRRRFGGPSSPDNKVVQFVEENAIIFIDEIDKLAGAASSRAEISRQGVQRDLLPLLDGCVINTRYGDIDTSNILFVCSGAFQLNKPEDMMVEILGRLPIRIEMEPLQIDDLVKILSVKENNILTEYKKLMSTEGIELVFEEAAIRDVAKIVYHDNQIRGNQGARRLYGAIEKLLRDITYLSSAKGQSQVVITPEYVANHLGRVNN